MNKTDTAKKVANTFSKAGIRLGKGIYHIVENYAQGEPANSNYNNKISMPITIKYCKRCGKKIQSQYTLCYDCYQRQQKMPQKTR